MVYLTSCILSQDVPHPWVPLSHTVPLVDAQGWEPLLLGVLRLLVGLLPTVMCAHGSSLWKLEAVPRVYFHSLQVSTLGGQPSASLLSLDFVTKVMLV